MSLVKFLLLGVFAMTTTGLQEFPQWRSSQHKILYQPDRNVSITYNIRGINWFGFNTNCAFVHGLWMHPFQYYLDHVLVPYGFNSVRLPLDYSIIDHWDTALPNAECMTADPDFAQKPIRTALHTIVEELRIRGISVLFDLHTFHNSITEQPFGDGIMTKEDSFRFWKTLMHDFSQYSNVLGIDIKNEPHGSERWDMWSDYVHEFVDMVRRDLSEFNGVLFMEGVQDTADASVWGGSFSGITNSAVPWLPNDRLVFSPHVYGASVKGESAIYDGEVQFNQWFGFLKKQYDNAIVIGEIGGLLVGDDLDWHYRLQKYLIQNNMTDSYYWCLNPDSYDTNGVLYLDWTTLDQNKIRFIQGLQPLPTFLTFP